MIDPEELKKRVEGAVGRYYTSPKYEKDRLEWDREVSRMAKARRREEKGVRTEHEEQKDVVAWLRAKKVLFCAIPNGSVLRGDGLERAKQMARLKAEGLRKGAPDLLVFTPPPALVGCNGVAIEMKSLSGTVSDEQKEFLAGLEKIGWQAFAAYGADEAILKLEGLGY